MVINKTYKVCLGISQVKPTYMINQKLIYFTEHYFPPFGSLLYPQQQEEGLTHRRYTVSVC